jgi:hypothetical protein
MTLDHDFDLSPENQSKDVRSGIWTNLPDSSADFGGITSRRDPAIEGLIKQQLSEYWRENVDFQDAELAEGESFAPASSPSIFESSEEMHAYYQREAEMTRAVDDLIEEWSQTTEYGAAAEHTPDIDESVSRAFRGEAAHISDHDPIEQEQLSDDAEGNTPALDLPPGKPAPHGYRKELYDPDLLETQIQSLCEQMSSRRWKKLSKMTHDLISSLVGNQHGKEHAEQVEYRQAAAALMISGINPLARTYYEWLTEKVGEEARQRFPDVTDEQISETCRVLVIQEVASDIYD